MAEYIEREKLASDFEQCNSRNSKWTAARVNTLIARQNAADVAPVVHAAWLDIVFDPMRRSMTATCSHCMVRGDVRVKSNECGFAVPDSDFCPSCGAKMDLWRRDDGA